MRWFGLEPAEDGLHVARPECRGPEFKVPDQDWLASRAARGGGSRVPDMGATGDGGAEPTVVAGGSAGGRPSTRVVVTGAPTEYASQAFLGELQQRLRQARARGMSAADAATVYLHASSDEVKARLRRYYAKTGGPAGGFSVPSAVLFAGKTHVRTVTERDVSKLLALVTAEARVRHSEKSERFARIGGPALWLAKRGAAAYVALTLAGGIIRPALRTVVYGVKALFPKSEPAYKFRPAENAVRQRTVYESFSDIRQAAAEASAAALGDDAYVRPATDPVPTEPFASIRQLERRAARSEATKSHDSIQATYNRDVPTREEVERFVWGDVQR